MNSDPPPSQNEPPAKTAVPLEISSDLAGRVDEVLEDFAEGADLDTAIVVEKSGALVSGISSEEVHVESISELVAGASEAMRKLVQKLGSTGMIESFHQSELRAVYLCEVLERYVLVGVSTVPVSVGLIRETAKQIRPNLIELLEEIPPEKPAPPVIEPKTFSLRAMALKGSDVGQPAAKPVVVPVVAEVSAAVSDEQAPIDDDADREGEDAEIEPVEADDAVELESDAEIEAEENEAVEAIEAAIESEEAPPEVAENEEESAAPEPEEQEAIQAEGEEAEEDQSEPESTEQEISEDSEPVASVEEVAAETEPATEEETPEAPTEVIEFIGDDMPEVVIEDSSGSVVDSPFEAEFEIHDSAEDEAEGDEAEISFEVEEVEEGEESFVSPNEAAEASIFEVEEDDEPEELVGVAFDKRPDSDASEDAIGSVFELDFEDESLEGSVEERPEGLIFEIEEEEESEDESEFEEMPPVLKVPAPVEVEPDEEVEAEEAAESDFEAEPPEDSVSSSDEADELEEEEEAPSAGPYYF